MSTRSRTAIEQAEAGRYLRQSQVRVKSGCRLVALLLAIAALAFLFDVTWLAKLSIAGAILFTVVTLLELLNVRLLRRRRSAESSISEPEDRRPHL